MTAMSLAPPGSRGSAARRASRRYAASNGWVRPSGSDASTASSSGWAVSVSTSVDSAAAAKGMSPPTTTQIALPVFEPAVFEPAGFAASRRSR